MTKKCDENTEPRNHGTTDIGDYVNSILDLIISTIYFLIVFKPAKAKPAGFLQALLSSSSSCRRRVVVCLLSQKYGKINGNLIKVNSDLIEVNRSLWRLEKS